MANGLTPVKPTGRNLTLGEALEMSGLTMEEWREENDRQRALDEIELRQALAEFEAEQSASVS